MKRWFWLPLAVLMLWPATAAAQEEDSSPQWWMVFTEEVAPENVAEFEANSAAMTELIKAHAPEGMVYFTHSSPEKGFSYAVPLEGGMAGFETLNEQWMGMVQEIGWEKWKEMAGTGLVEHSTANFYVERPDLSAMSDETQAMMPEMPVRHFDWLYPTPGMEEEFEAKMKEWVAVYTEQGIEPGWLAYQAVTGDNLPMYVLLTPAKTASEYYSMSEKIDEMLGEAGQKLMMESMAVMRDFEHNEAYFRPDLSMLPPDDM